MEPKDTGLFAALLGAHVPVPSPDALRVYGEERGRAEIQAMAEDLGVLREGEGFMTRDPAVFPLEISLALWKRLKALETPVVVTAQHAGRGTIHRASTERDLRSITGAIGDRGFTVDDQQWWLFTDQGWTKTV